MGRPDHADYEKCSYSTGRSSHAAVHSPDRSIAAPTRVVLSRHGFMQTHLWAFGGRDTVMATSGMECRTDQSCVDVSCGGRQGGHGNGSRV